VMGNLIPSLTITAVSTDWTEVVLDIVILADNRRVTHGTPNAFVMLSLTKENCTGQKIIAVLSQLSPLDHFQICFELREREGIGSQHS